MAAHTQGHQRRIARFNPHPLAKDWKLACAAWFCPSWPQHMHGRVAIRWRNFSLRSVILWMDNPKRYVSRATASTDLSSTVQACDGKSKDQLFKFFHWNT